MEKLGIRKRQRALLRKSEKHYRDQLGGLLRFSEEIQSRIFAVAHGEAWLEQEESSDRDWQDVRFEGTAEEIAESGGVERMNERESSS